MAEGAEEAGGGACGGAFALPVPKKRVDLTAQGLSMSPDVFDFEGVRVSSAPTEFATPDGAFVARLQDFERLSLLGRGLHGRVWIDCSLGFCEALRI